jgi:hypothetical protein
MTLILQGDHFGGTIVSLDVESPPTLSVTLSGTAQEGQTLTAAPTLGTDSDNTIADVRSACRDCIGCPVGAIHGGAWKRHLVRAR